LRELEMLNHSGARMRPRPAGCGCHCMSWRAAAMRPPRRLSRAAARGAGACRAGARSSIGGCAPAALAPVERRRAWPRHSQAGCLAGPSWSGPALALRGHLAAGASRLAPGALNRGPEHHAALGCLAARGARPRRADAGRFALAAETVKEAGSVSAAVSIPHANIPAAAEPRGPRDRPSPAERCNRPARSPSAPAPRHQGDGHSDRPQTSAKARQAVHARESPPRVRPRPAIAVLDLDGTAADYERVARAGGSSATGARWPAA